MSIYIVAIFVLFSLAFYLAVFSSIQKLKNCPVLPDHPPDGTVTPEVTVVMAARNERGQILNSINSFLNQSGVKQIIVVDDHSTDNTPQVLEKLQKQNLNIKFLEAPSLPPGWTGKNFALHYGSRFVFTPYILFTDADVILSPGTVIKAIHYMYKHNLAHLSGNFYIQCKTVIEHICAPTLTASSALALFNSSQGSATGAFNMVQTDFYRKIGGHAQICDNLVDDVALARLIKENSGSTVFLDLSDKAKVRLFKGLKGFWQVISRSAEPYLKNRFGLLIVGGLFISGIALVTISLPFLIFMLYFPCSKSYCVLSYSLLGLCILNYLAGFVSCFRMKKYSDSKLLYVPFYPLAVFVLGFASSFSAFRKLVGIKISWKGRNYPPH